MINEERVAEMYHMAVYDKHADRETEQAEEYYGSDYIWKEVLKSFFTGTFAFIFIAVFLILGAMSNMEEIYDSIDLLGTGVSVVLLYLAFEITYLVITALVYRYKFKASRTKFKKFSKHLKKVSKMYAREEKLRG